MEIISMGMVYIKQLCVNSSRPQRAYLWVSMQSFHTVKNPSGHAHAHKYTLYQILAVNSC